MSNNIFTKNLRQRCGDVSNLELDESFPMTENCKHVGLDTSIWIADRVENVSSTERL